MAGGKRDTANLSFYLKKIAWYWSFSPYMLYSDGYAYVYYVNTSGNLNYSNVIYGGGLAPVINLSAEYAMHLEGTGTMGDPFVLND